MLGQYLGLGMGGMERVAALTLPVACWVAGVVLFVRCLTSRRRARIVEGWRTRTASTDSG